jgi:hypothetical protein
MATAISDNIDSAREFAIQTVTRVAESRGWTSEQLSSALADIEAAYDDVTGFEAGAYIIGGLFGSASSGELQVLTFTSSVAERARNWTAPGGDELQDVFQTAAGLQEDFAERSTSTVTDYAGDAAAAAGNTVADVVAVGTDQRTYWIIGAAALVVLVLVARRR